MITSGRPAPAANVVLGAAPNHGVLVGLAYHDGRRETFRWLREEPFTHRLSNLREDSAVLVDRLPTEGTLHYGETFLTSVLLHEGHRGPDGAPPPSPRTHSTSASGSAPVPVLR